MFHRLRNTYASEFFRDDNGAVLAEMLIVIPFITVFALGILEFGNVFWQKEQIETGLRDAARYLARCQTDATFAAACTQSLARNIAFFGTASPAAGQALRVAGWGPDAADIVITIDAVAGVIRVDAGHEYESSPLFGWLGIGAITTQAYHEQRYIGW